MCGQIKSRCSVLQLSKFWAATYFLKCWEKRDRLFCLVLNSLSDTNKRKCRAREKNDTVRENRNEPDEWPLLYSETRFTLLVFILHLYWERSIYVLLPGMKEELCEVQFASKLNTIAEPNANLEKENLSDKKKKNHAFLLGRICSIACRFLWSRRIPLLLMNGCPLEIMRNRTFGYLPKTPLLLRLSRKKKGGGSSYISQTTSASKYLKA